MGSWEWVPLKKDKVKRPRKTIKEQINSFNSYQRRIDYNSRISRVENYICDSEDEQDEEVVNSPESSEHYYNSAEKEDESEMEREDKDVPILKKPTRNHSNADPLQETAVENKRRKSERAHHGQGIRWERGELIGSGTYGKVYQGLNLNNGKLIAIKSVQIGSKKTATRELMALKYEISILRELDHPHIVKYLYTDADPIKKRVDILLEYVPGGSLSELLKKFGPFNEKITKIYLIQMLDALSYIHSKGIVHRDLKCANVLINNDASIKISDFGASKKLTKTKDAKGYEPCKSLKGSPYWLAPEVANRVGHDTSVDIWSLGCWTIEMITGRPPWSDRSKKASKVISLIKNSKEKITVPKGLSEECYDFIFHSCLQRDPRKRWTAEELIHHPFLKKRPTSVELNQMSLENKENTNIVNHQSEANIISPDHIQLEINGYRVPNDQNEIKSSVSNPEESKGAVVPLPNISKSISKVAEDDSRHNDNEDNAYKTSNFSRWSDTQFDDGTCSLSFLKLWKTEEERAKKLEQERIKLQMLLKQEIQKKTQQTDENPFAISKQAVEPAGE